MDIQLIAAMVEEIREEANSLVYTLDTLDMRQDPSDLADEVVKVVDVFANRLSLSLIKIALEAGKSIGESL